MTKINTLLKYKLPATILISAILSFSIIFTAQAGNVSDLRGKRYCEILISTNKARPAQMQVYNTIGLNDCPANIWNKITVDEIKQETNAATVHLNGPRYWMIDGMQNSNLVNPDKRNLGGLEMRDAGILKLGPMDLLKAMKPYQEHKVHRQTTWVYKAGKPIYELKDPNGKVYVMQSYSVQKTAQTEAGLADLGSKLTLPKGWSFQTRVLKKDAFLTPVDEKAVVIQDDFLNTYQQETPGFNGDSK